MTRNVRRALVTGAARGVGHATCPALAERGYEVVGVDIREREDGHGPGTVTARETR